MSLQYMGRDIGKNNTEFSCVTSGKDLSYCASELQLCLIATLTNILV